MSLEDFLLENVETVAPVEIYLSPRFKSPFKIKAIAEAENSRIRQGCRKKVKQKYGQYTTETDQDTYLLRLTAACTVEPDFKSAALQESWGVVGEEALIGAMLTPGEYAELLNRIQEICGFDLDMEEAKDDIKKPTETATANYAMPDTVCTNWD